MCFSRASDLGALVHTCYYRRVNDRGQGCGAGSLFPPSHESAGFPRHLVTLSAIALFQLYFRYSFMGALSPIQDLYQIGGLRTALPERGLRFHFPNGVFR